MTNKCGDEKLVISTVNRSISNTAWKENVLKTDENGVIKDIDILVRKKSTLMSTSPTQVSDIFEKSKYRPKNDSPMRTLAPDTVTSRVDLISTFPPTMQAANNQHAWPIFTPSSKSVRTRNPIREIVDPIIASMAQSNSQVEGNNKEIISLAVSARSNF